MTPEPVPFSPRTRVLTPAELAQMLRVMLEAGGLAVAVGEPAAGAQGQAFPDKELLTIDEAAERCSLGKQAIYRLLQREPQLRFTAGRSVRVKWRAFRQWLDTHQELESSGKPPGKAAATRLRTVDAHRTQAKARGGTA